MNTWKEKRPYSITAVRFPNGNKKNNKNGKMDNKNALEERTTAVQLHQPMHIGKIIKQMGFPTQPAPHYHAARSSHPD